MVSNSIQNFINLNSLYCPFMQLFGRDEFTVVSEIIATKKIRTQLHDLIEELKTEARCSNLKSAWLSGRKREEGNRLFREDKKANALATSRCYTDAILSAPKDTEELAMAHANRAAALAEFGYYFDAYTDCELALELGYPKEKSVKLFFRQAYCSIKLKHCLKLEAVLEKLRDIDLSGQLAKQREDLEVQLKILKELPSGWNQDPPHDYKVQNILLDPEKGRYMCAWKDYQQDEVILSEKPFAFVPISKSPMCFNCAKENFIPFPCYSCSVIYCSQNCKLADEKIHQYECFAHRSGLYNSVGIVHFAMNILIRGLPEILDKLVDNTSAKEVWQSIDKIAKSSKSPKKGYAEVLALNNNFLLFDLPTIRGLALASVIGAYSLIFCTEFSDVFPKYSMSSFDWITVLSALILRHSTQAITNAQYVWGNIFSDDSCEYPALTDIWVAPQHLKKRLLHKFEGKENGFCGLYPYLSLCNHSCKPTFWLSPDGNRLVCKTRRDLKKGSEISNCYTFDYKHSTRDERGKSLKNTYNFVCKCEICASDSNDKDYLQIFKYICRNVKCNKKFTSDNRWWLHVHKDDFEPVICPYCETAIEIDWFMKFADLFNAAKLNSSQIKEGIEIFEYAKRKFESTSLHYYVAYKMSVMFFKAWQEHELEEELFVEMGHIVKYWLEITGEMDDFESLVYATNSTYALGLMAEGKYFDFDGKKIRKSFESFSMEWREVFENYITDYIGDRFNECCS